MKRSRNAGPRSVPRARALCPGPVAILPPPDGPEDAARQAEVLLALIFEAMRGAAAIAAALALGRELREIGVADDLVAVQRTGAVFTDMLGATATPEIAKLVL